MSAPSGAVRSAGGPAALLPCPREFARRWASALADTSYVPASAADVRAFLVGLTDQLLDALTAEPFDPEAARPVGAALVARHFTSGESLGRTVALIGDGPLAELPMVDPVEARSRLARLLGSLAEGFAHALLEHTLDAQEEIRSAAVLARADTERELHASEARLRHQALHDALTGLPNRTLFAERLHARFAKAEPGARVGVCYLDIDGFKVVNDRLGHDVGDELLVAVADRLQRCVTAAGHVLARLGGDEFVILVADPASTADVVAVAEAVLAALATPFAVAGHRLSVSASIGVVERPVAGTSTADVLRAADMTLYWAKSDGKARWALFDPERSAREVAGYELVAAMPGALERGEFVLDYQPLVGLACGSVLGAEALVRWRHPRLGLLSPGTFVGLAEETGMIVPLGRWVLETACREAARWQRLAPGTAPRVSVNLAVRQAQEPGLVDDVAAILNSTGLPPDRLQLELTESAVIGPGHEPLAALTALAGMGVRIAIDDFGTGYSNLAYLCALPVHALKLAGSFVDGLRTSDRPEPAGERVVATLVRLAHDLGLTVTAEGVETREQAERLRAVRCDAGQGWFFARPGPPDQIARRLARPARTPVEPASESAS